MQPKRQDARSSMASSPKALSGTSRASQSASKPNAAALRLQNYSLKACHIPAQNNQKTSRAPVQK